MKSWSTEAVAAPEQFAYWREVVCEAFAALDPRSAERGAGFASRVDMEGIGAINVARIRAEAHTVVRDFSQIRRDPQDRLFVNLQVAGQGIVRQHPVTHGHAKATGGCIQRQVIEVEHQVLIGPLVLALVRLQPQVPFVARGRAMDQRMAFQRVQ